MIKYLCFVLKTKSMKPQLVFSILRVGTNILYFLMIILTVIVAVTCILKISGMSEMGDHQPVFTHEVKAFGENIPKSVVAYSADKLVSYTTKPENYKLQVGPNSALGYFSFYNAILNLCIGVSILGLFRKIFRETNLIGSFKQQVYRRLIILAVIFAVSDVINFVNYFIFNSLLRKSISVPHFELVTDAGNGLVTGLIIYAIAIIYQRGISIQEENELTV